MKPMMSPRPRRRDRPSGARSRRFRESLLQTSGSRIGTRLPADKRRALGRLLDRYEPSPHWKLWSVLALAAIAGSLLFLARAQSGASDLVGFGDDPDGYGRLVAVMGETCAASACAYGWSSPVRPPAEMQHLMSRLRVRDAYYDAVADRATLLGTYRASFSLLFEGPSGRLSDAQQERRAAAGLNPPSWVEGRDLGGGWRLVPDRLRARRPL